MPDETDQRKLRTSPYPRFLPAGEAALVVELGGEIALAVNARVRALDRLVADAAIAGVAETLPTNRSLFIAYEPLTLSFGALVRRVEVLLASLPEAPAETAGKSWLIPVAYGGVYGVDLAGVAATLGMSEAAAIERHAAPEYRVFMIGFQPGFAYLGPLDAALFVSRHDAPRAEIPAGTVSIAGPQTVINSVAAPSGWKLIGRTPVRLFDLRRAAPFLLAPGDRVRFRPVPGSAFDALEARAAAGEILAEAS